MRASESAESPAGPTPATVFAPDRSSLSALTARCRALCHSAVRTIAVLPDREWQWLHFLGSGSPTPALSIEDVWRDFGPDVAAEVQSARRTEAEARQRRLPRYRPEPAEVSRCLDVLRWMTWLERKRHGRAQCQIIAARAYEVSFARLAKRFGRSDETIRRWEIGGITEMALRFKPELEAMR